MRFKGSDYDKEDRHVMTYSKENVRNMQLLVTSLLQIKTGNSKLLIIATNNETLLMGESAVTKVRNPEEVLF